jgi:hypothetical protein
MSHPHLKLDTLPHDAAKVEAICHYAHAVGAAMAVSGYFCPPGTYWADMIAPGRVSLGRGTTPLAAALDALTRFTEGDHVSGSSSVPACSRRVSS